jgi:hypothetical protein
MLPDPFGDQSRDPENLRGAVLDHVRQGRGRSIDASALVQSYLDRVADQAITNVLTTIEEAGAAEALPLMPQVMSDEGGPAASDSQDAPERSTATAQTLSELIGPLIDVSAETFVGEHGALGTGAREIATPHVSPAIVVASGKPTELAHVTLGQAASRPLRVGLPTRVVVVRIDETQKFVLSPHPLAQQHLPWFEGPPTVGTATNTDEQPTARDARTLDQAPHDLGSL